jgi:hypothetical protein
VSNKSLEIFVYLEAKFMGEKLMFVVDPGFHMQNCRECIKYAQSAREERAARVSV